MAAREGDDDNQCYRCEKPIGVNEEHKWTITTQVDGNTVPLAGSGVAGGLCNAPLSRSKQRLTHQIGCQCFAVEDHVVKADGTRVPRPKVILAEFNSCVLRVIDEQQLEGINHGIKWGGNHLGWCLDLTFFTNSKLPLRNAFAKTITEFNKSSGGSNRLAGISQQWWGMLAAAALVDIRGCAPTTGKLLDLMISLLEEEGSKAFGGALKHEAAKQIVAHLAEHNDHFAARVEQMHNGLRVHAMQAFENQARITDAMEQLLAAQKEIKEQQKLFENDKLAKAQLVKKIKEVECTMVEQLLKLTDVQETLAELIQAPHACDVDEVEGKVRASFVQASEMINEVGARLETFNFKFELKLDKMGTDIEALKKSLADVKEKLEARLADRNMLNKIVDNIAMKNMVYLVVLVAMLAYIFMVK